MSSSTTIASQTSLGRCTRPTAIAPQALVVSSRVMGAVDSLSDVVTACASGLHFQTPRNCLSDQHQMIRSECDPVSAQPLAQISRPRCEGNRSHAWSPALVDARGMCQGRDAETDRSGMNARPTRQALYPAAVTRVVFIFYFEAQASLLDNPASALTAAPFPPAPSARNALLAARRTRRPYSRAPLLRPQRRPNASFVPPPPVTLARQRLELSHACGILPRQTS